MAARVLEPCAHCRGTGRCAQVCCRVFGNAVRHGEDLVFVCMVCRGTGRKRQAGA